MFLTSYCRIKNYRVDVNGSAYFSSEKQSFEDFIHALYQYTQTHYPKFYKMDNQSKLGMIAAELLLAGNSFLQKYSGEEVGVVLSNAVASADADQAYYATIADPANYFPGPALFVYTLPSMVTGEICIKYKIKGENAFFISEDFNPDLLYSYIDHVLKSKVTKACLGGWINYDADQSDAFLFTVEPTPGPCQEPWNVLTLHQLYINSPWTR